MFTRDRNLQMGWGVILMVGLCLLGSESGFAGENRAMRGWELNSPYNKLYKASEMDSFKGTVVDVKEEVDVGGDPRLLQVFQVPPPMKHGPTQRR